MGARTRFVFHFASVFSSPRSGSCYNLVAHTLEELNAKVMRDEQALSVQFKMKGMQTTIVECRYLHKSGSSCVKCVCARASRGIACDIHAYYKTSFPLYRKGVETSSSFNFDNNVTRGKMTELFRSNDEK